MSNSNKKYSSIALLTSTLILALSLSACNKAQSTDKFLADAKQYQQKGDNKAAIIQLKNALQQDANNKDARFLLGSIYLETGDALSAEKELQKAVSLGVSPATALQGLSKAKLMLGKAQQVLDDTAQDPRAKTDPAFMSLRGNAYMALGKKPEMKDAFEQVLKIDPNYPDALIGLASLAISEGDMDGAHKYADIAVSKNPKNSRVLMFKANLLRAQSKFPEALTAFDDAAKAETENGAAFVAKAEIEIGLKKFEEAQKDISAAKKIGGNAVLVFYTQALLDFSQEKYTAAWESLQQVQKLAPDYLPGLLLSGSVQMAMGSYPQAERFLRKYLEKNPNNLYAQKLLISSVMKGGDSKAALALIEPLLLTNKQDSQLFALAGESYMQQKNFNKATESFEKASALAPKSVEYHTALGLSKLSMGDNGSAIAELEKAKELDAKSSNAGVLLIMTHMRMKETDKALAAANAAEKEQAGNPVIQNLKGAIYLEKKDPVKARASFEKALTLQENYFPSVLNLARMDYQDKKPEAARKRLETVLEKDKKNLQVIVALANLAITEKKEAEAKKWLVLGTTEHPDNPGIVQMQTQYLMSLGEKDKALDLAKKAQASHPTEPDFMELLAMTKLGVGDKTGALDSYQRLAAMLPGSAANQYKVAGAHMGLNDSAAAIDALKKTLGIDPHYFEAQLALGSLLAKKGNLDEVLTLSRQIQKDHDKSPAGFIMEGDVLMQQKKAAAALAAYEKAYKLNQNGNLIVKLHGAMLVDGKAKDAELRINKWLKEHPADNETRMYLANYNMPKQKSKLAYIEQLQLILKTAPESVMVLNNLAWAYGEEKDPRALEYAEKANKLAENTPVVMDTLGWILVEKGDLARGLPLLEKASAGMSEVLDVRYHYAMALLKSGDKAKAQKELEFIAASKKPFAKMDEVKALLKQNAAT
ncbi:XrtA/PEP-CTERM system TPR-repeat protein PrsT [Undibacterium sp.]|uniref:XrtA/PEP-CTERM system TPR-repeat protein PrsT n=1 Tax=Undibacterium sp. TaxID=1914977 RepID=UPI0025F5987E|nr:XrtA/PEP-CTERM system TPR-repeat protein PrsT [Undibacterium sp.]